MAFSGGTSVDLSDHLRSSLKWPDNLCQGEPVSPHFIPADDIRTLSFSPCGRTVLKVAILEGDANVKVESKHRHQSIHQCVCVCVCV